MTVETTYSDARAHLAHWLDRVTEDREVVLVKRRGRSRVALVAADELESLMETAHLLRSPRNATRLLAALRKALESQGRPQSVASLRKALGFGQEA